MSVHSSARPNFSQHGMYSPRSTWLGYTWKLNARPKRRLLAEYPPQPLFEPFWPRVNLSELAWSAGTPPSKDHSGKGLPEPAGGGPHQQPRDAPRARPAAERR